METEKILRSISSWVPDYDELKVIAAQKYDIPELFSEGILLSEAVLTKIFCGDPDVEHHFSKLMLREATDIHEMIFKSWMLKYFNKPWEVNEKKKLDNRILKYIETRGLPGRFSKLGPLYAMYLSFAIGKVNDSLFEEPKEPSFIANYLIFRLNSGDKIDRKLLTKLIKSQGKNGGFPASSLTTKKETIYGTALALIPLIVDNYKSKYTKSAINFLLNNKPPYGFVKNGEPQLYVNLIVSYVLRLYSFFEEAYSDPIIKLVSDKKELNRILYSQFDSYLAKEFELVRLDHSVMNSLGTKFEVKARRQDIYNLLLDHGGLDPARIIDLLKEKYPTKYNHLKKRSHLTLIKLDLEYMRHMGLLGEYNSRYFII